MTGELIDPNAPTMVPGPVVHARSDAQLVELWLHGRPATTAAAYARDAAVLFGVVGKPLGAMTLGDLQAFADGLTGLAPASVARKLKAVKSLTSFAHRLGYLALDLARPLRVPPIKQVRAERIVQEAQVERLIAMEPNPRNHVLLRLLYGCGLRISEACGLRWRDLQGTRKGGQATIMGKGGTTRVVLIQPKLWKAIGQLRREAGPDDPVLHSAAGCPLDRSAAHRVVKAAVHRAGLPAEVSAHWLRHAHASHALDHGAPLPVVKESLGHASLTTTSIYVHARPEDGSARYLEER